MSNNLSQSFMYNPSVSVPPHPHAHHHLPPPPPPPPPIPSPERRQIQILRDFIFQHPELSPNLTNNTRLVTVVLSTLDQQASRIENVWLRDLQATVPANASNLQTRPIEIERTALLANVTATSNENASPKKSAPRTPNPNSHRLSRTTDKEWLEMYGQLKWYKAKEGHCLVPYKFAENPKLGYWVDNQRKSYRSFKEGKPGKISEYRIKALEDIGFVWNPKKDCDEDTWKRRVEELKEFKSDNGHCRVPRTFAQFPKLGGWVNWQRANYRYLNEGKNNSLTPNRVQELEEIGFNWEAKAETWETRLDELKAFKAEKGHTQVPHKYHQSPKLATWVNNQRAHYRYRKEGKPSFMNEDRIKALEEIGFNWDVNKDTWDERYEEIKSFKNEHGHVKVSAKLPQYRKLASWINNQRKHYRSNGEGKPSPMTAERVNLLENIGIDWEVKRGRAKDDKKEKKRVKTEEIPKEQNKDILNEPISEEDIKPKELTDVTLDSTIGEELPSIQMCLV